MQPSEAIKSMLSLAPDQADHVYFYAINGLLFKTKIIMQASFQIFE